MKKLLVLFFVFVLVLSCSVNVFAADSSSDFDFSGLPKSNDDEYVHIVVAGSMLYGSPVDGSARAYVVYEDVSATEPNIKLLYKSVLRVSGFSRGLDYYAVFKTSDYGQTWVLDKPKTVFPTGDASTLWSFSGASIDFNYVYYSTDDIVDYDTGDVLFTPPPPPPPPTPPTPLVVSLKAEILKGAQAVVGTMSTLTLCGVGCLALVVVLSLFGKVLFRFLA